MKTIALAGETYSRNLGDQAIHASLAYILRQQNASLKILPLDISGRQGADSPGKNRAFYLLRAITSSNSLHSLVNIVFHSLQKSRQQMRMWSPVLETSDQLVIGGGQLLMDNNLDFPLKLSGLASLAGERGIPYHISACGVGRTWSRFANRLFQPVLVNAKSVTLRDELSRSRLDHFIPSLQTSVTFDPAILAAEVYPDLQKKVFADRIGLGIMCREDVNSHLLPAQRYSTNAWLDLWLGVLFGLLKENLVVELFTTGSSKDMHFAQSLFYEAHAHGWNGVTLAGGQTGPGELMASMRNYSLIIATRLHASILANSLGISSLGLNWDEKVRAYYGETGLTDRCFNLVGLQISGVVRAACDLNRQPFSSTLLAQLKDRARENVYVIIGKGLKDH